MSNILGLDLGEFKGLACLDDPATANDANRRCFK